MSEYTRSRNFHIRCLTDLTLMSLLICGLFGLGIALFAAPLVTPHPIAALLCLLIGGSIATAAGTFGISRYHSLAYGDA